jgi:nucleoid DNA-binding protein
MDRTEADVFMRGMFELIEEALVTEKFVKVKGLGTFKLTEVDSRESVNVRTGERFEIQEHRKISFIPEAGLKDLINKPFAHFESVALNENTVLPDTEVFVEAPSEVKGEENRAEEEVLAAEAPIAEAPVVEAQVNETPSEEKALDGRNPEEASVVEDSTEANNSVEETSEAKAPEEEITEEKTPEKEVIEEKAPEEEVAEGKTPEETIEPSIPEESSNAEKKTTQRKRKWPLALLFVFLLILVGIGIGAWVGIFDKNNTAPVEVVEVKTEAPVVAEPADSMAVDSLSAVADSVATSALAPEAAEQKAAPENADAKAAHKTAESQPKAESQANVEQTATSVPKAAYRMVGTKEVHILESGETLRIIAEKYYGNRNLSKYIYEYNKSVITNPDRVPAGTKLNIPELEANR